jgi:hypothetical protein
LSLSRLPSDSIGLETPSASLLFLSDDDLAYRCGYVGPDLPWQDIPPVAQVPGADFPAGRDDISERGPIEVA